MRGRKPRPIEIAPDDLSLLQQMESGTPYTPLVLLPGHRTARLAQDRKGIRNRLRSRLGRSRGRSVISKPIKKWFLTPLTIHKKRFLTPFDNTVPSAPRAEPGGLPSSRSTAIDFHRYIFSISFLRHVPLYSPACRRQA
jgi:hypothetical protein